MVRLPRMLRITSLRNLCKAYRCFLKKWFSCTRRPQSPFEDFVLKDKRKGRRMIGIKSSSFRSYHNHHGPDEVTSPRGFYWHITLDKCFPSISSLSRNNNNNVSRKSRRTQTTSPTNNVGVGVSKSRERERERERDHDHSVHTNPSTPKSTCSSNSFSKSRRIMYSNSSGLLKPPPIERHLECTLEELCYGCKKFINIARQLQSHSGEMVEEEEVITIDVKPGWTRGTKIKFEGKGNDRDGTYGEDLIYYISEKTHHLFTREGDDLELTLQIPLLNSLTSSTFSVPLLGGHYMDLTVDDDHILHPGYQKIITGQGMPIPKHPEKRGNLRVTFLVQFPTHLTPDQRSQVVSILQDCC